MGVNIDEILASLEQEKTAEANFADGLSNEDSTPESTENTDAANEANAPAEAAETVKEASDNSYEVSEEDAEKIAADCDAQGRIMARAFVGELNKLAAEADDEPVSETSEPVSNEVIETDQATETASETEKSAAENIVGSLYNNFFGEEE